MLVALAGIGEVALQQHVPAINNSPQWELAATCSRNGSVPGIESYQDIATLLKRRPDIEMISLCQPPEPRFAYAVSALSDRRHLMLEKPPGTTVSSCRQLEALAKANQRTLFTTWHSREADQVDAAMAWLASRKVRKVEIIWREDVHRWHAGQEWIWQPGGFGVFDPGINAISILTKILPDPVHLVSAELEFPANKQTPIAATLKLTDITGTSIDACFDWREKGEQQWLINVETSDGELRLINGGSQLLINGEPVSNTDHYQKTTGDEAAETLANEYGRLYQRMADLIEQAQSDVDLLPLQLVADAFVMGERRIVEAFKDE
ncbi:MAG: Gfo/Idh/MocA family oxidoreductase [Gammaproteobacteria bacterium]|nr:Gfo/Idh/MocA family oxidoreductase [Gammaproteobacteria bacterium]